MDIESQLDTISLNLKRLIDARGLKLNEIARATRIPQGSLFRLAAGLSKNPTAHTLLTIANYFKVSVDYLLGLEETSFELKVPIENTVCDPNALRKIPLIEWDKIKEWAYWGLGTLPENFDNWILYESQVDAKAFAVYIRNYIYKHSFPKGYTLIVEPQAAYKADDYVIASVRKNTPSIKLITEEDGKLYLNSLATSLASEPLEQPNAVYGKIIRMSKDLRRSS